MAGSVTRTHSLAPLSSVDLASVRVELAGAGGKRTRLGTALEALRDRRLTAAERAAIEALVRAVELLRGRAGYAGIDDAGTGVTLLLRDGDASTRGPWATTGSVAVGTKNALGARNSGRSRPDVLLTVDAAVHELAHVVQFARMPASATPHAAILEGIADSVAMLATGDDTLGEGFFRDDANGRPQGSIRELGTPRTSGPALGTVIRTYAEATRPGAEEHAAGGVVSTTFQHLRARVGRDRAEQLLWIVIRDQQAWKAGGSWRELAEAMRRAASSDIALRDAVEAALTATGLVAATR